MEEPSAESTLTPLGFFLNKVAKSAKVFFFNPNQITEKPISIAAATAPKVMPTIAPADKPPPEEGLSGVGVTSPSLDLALWDSEVTSLFCEEVSFEEAELGTLDEEAVFSELA